MYNRYIRNDRGTYTRITEDDGDSRRPQNASPPGPPPGVSGPSRSPAPGPSRPPEPPPRSPATDSPSGPPPTPDTPPRRPPHAPTPHRSAPGPAPQDGLRGFLRHILNIAHMENTDTGDLLTLCLLYLLYREGADEELLVALGLLLIL